MNNEEIREKSHLMVLIHRAIRKGMAYAYRVSDKKDRTLLEPYKEYSREQLQDKLTELMNFLDLRKK